MILMLCDTDTIGIIAMMLMLCDADIFGIIAVIFMLHDIAMMAIILMHYDADMEGRPTIISAMILVP